MESTHQRFLFTSYDALKKRTSERSERVGFFSMHHDEWIKTFQILSMV